MVLASAAVGRRLSKDWEHSPPDINSRRASNLDVRPTRPATLDHLRTSPVRETASASNLSGALRPRPYSASATWARENPHVGARLGSSASLQRPRRRARSDAEPADRPRAARRKPEYESIIEVNVTCCDPPADDAGAGSGSGGGGSGGGGGGSLGPGGSQARGLGLSVSRTALLSPLSLRETASPSRRRHRSNPAGPADSSFELSTSSVSLSPLQQELDEEVFENIPPPPPPPNCNTHNSSSGASSPLERLEREELVMLWCSSESELRSQLLRAIQAKEPP